MTVEKNVNDTLKTGFNLLKKNYVAFIIGTIIAVVGSIFVITIPPFIFGIYIMGQKLVDGKKVEFTDVFKGFEYLITSWVLFITAAFLVIVGFIFLIIPGLFMLVLFQYSIPLAIKNGRGGIAALKESASLTQNNLSYSLVLWILFMVISSVGSITQIGWLLTVPYTVICTCVAVKKLGGKKTKK